MRKWEGRHGDPCRLFKIVSPVGFVHDTRREKKNVITTVCRNICREESTFVFNLKKVVLHMLTKGYFLPLCGWRRPAAIFACASQG